MKNKYSLKKRQKAPFGTIIAAGINAATTLTAAAMQAQATQQAAQKQAAAIEANGEKQAEALRLQNENNTKLQNQSIAFSKEENERNRAIQRTAQLNLQMQMGNENEYYRQQQGRIVVKNGGKKGERKLRNISPLLQGDGNLPFMVTDGGGVIPLGHTPEGFGLYEIIGNDHEHYHKTRGGKHKTGVGIKFADGTVVEGEGNQKGNQGELLLTTPDDAMFISRHTLRGFNPAQAVNAGMHPLDAYQAQENIKDAYNIADEGGYNPPLKKGGRRSLRTAGGNYAYILPAAYQGIDYGSNIYTNGAYTPINYWNGGSRATAKYGKRVKAWWGNRYSPNYMTTFVDDDPTYGETAAGTHFVTNADGTKSVRGGDVLDEVGATAKRKTKTYDPSWYNINNEGKYDISPFLGAGITTLGNVGAALLGNWGANRASRTLAGAYNRAGQLMADAYDRLGGIDMSAIRREDFRPAHAMAAIRSARVNVNPNLVDTNRELRRAEEATNNSTLSSAARLNRFTRLRDAAALQRDKIYADQANKEEAIKQGNLEQINRMADANATRDVQASKDYTSAYLNMLQYNNDIANEKILGKANALGTADVQANSAIANARQAAASNWANAITSSGNAFNSAITAYNDMVDRRRLSEENFKRAFLFADEYTGLRALQATGDPYNMAKSIYNSITNSQEYKDLITLKNSNSLSAEDKDRLRRYDNKINILLSLMS